MAYLLHPTNTENEAPRFCPVSLFAPKVRHKGTSSCTGFMTKPEGYLKLDDFTFSVILLLEFLYLEIVAPLRAPQMVSQ